MWPRLVARRWSFAMRGPESSMIIEFFGPPGVGKTTFTHALAARLREGGRACELKLSSRPAELFSESGAGMTAQVKVAGLRRLSRPIFEAFALLWQTPTDKLVEPTALIKILPPKNIIQSIRLRQYIWRLSYDWHRASSAAHIVLFDQGFVQVVCSLALLAQRTDKRLTERALDNVPKADLFIRLDAPADILESRLRDRTHHQGVIERLCELDLKTNLAFIPIVDELDDLLRRRDHNVIRATSLDRGALCKGVAAIEQQLTGSVIAAGRDHKRIDENLASSRGTITTNEQTEPHLA
jgi:RecA/RadA recombinase